MSDTTTPAPDLTPEQAAEEQRRLRELETLLSTMRKRADDVRAAEIANAYAAGQKEAESRLASDRDRLAKELEQERAKLQAAERVVSACRPVAKWDDPEVRTRPWFPELHEALAAYDSATTTDGGGKGGE